MLALFVLLGVANARGGDVEVVCASPIAPEKLSLVPVVEEPGRYRVQHCRPPRSDWQWDITLRAVDQPPESCSYSHLGERGNGPQHSHSSVEFTPDINCSYVCVAQNFDLLFRGCYSVHSSFKGRFSSQPYNTYYYVDNDLTLEYFNNSSHWYQPYDHENMVSFIWETKIPITDFEVLMSKNVNDTEEVDVTRNCTLAASAHRLACELRAARGCPRLTLSHRAPWAGSRYFTHLSHVYADFCPEGEARAPVSGARGLAPWALATVAVGGAAALAALLVVLRYRRLDAQLKKRVLQYWIDRTDDSRRPGAVAPLEGILLLHARDCAALERFARALAAVLRAHLGITVWDLYSPEVVSQWGAAPAAWLRAVLAAPRVRTVLLQTPALRLLHPPPPAPAPAPQHRVALPAPTVEHFVAPLSYCLLADLCNHSWVPECGRDYNNPSELRTFRDECDLLEYNCDYDRVEEPLLERRVVHRVPHCGDALLPLAVRLLADAAPAPACAYRRHYLATVSSLEVEVLREVVPYRRYVLPRAVGALLSDLAPPGTAAPPGTVAPPAAALRELHAAHAALLQYVADNPDYFLEELMYI